MKEEASGRRGSTSQPDTARAATVSRQRNLIVLGVSSVVLVLSALAARAALTDAEVAVFRAANDLPQGLYTVVWPVMQYGTFITIPALAVIALVFRRFRFAAAMLLSGVGVYLLAIVIKGIVERGRPASLLDGVEGREVFAEGSLGFPSGHAAVAAALTVVVAAIFQGAGRWLRSRSGSPCSSAACMWGPTFLSTSSAVPRSGPSQAVSSTC